MTRPEGVRGLRPTRGRRDALPCLIPKEAVGHLLLVPTQDLQFLDDTRQGRVLRIEDHGTCEVSCEMDLLQEDVQVVRNSQGLQHTVPLNAIAQDHTPVLPRGDLRGHQLQDPLDPLLAILVVLQRPAVVLAHAAPPSNSRVSLHSLLSRNPTSRNPTDCS